MGQQTKFKETEIGKIPRVNMRKYTESEIKKRVEIALGMLLKNDVFLLKHDVNERSISHKLAEYLQQLFPDYHVDCEYNRIGKEKINGEWTKKVLDLDVVSIASDDECGTTVYPDIIVHCRGEQENVLVIETKKIGKDKTNDEKKLKAFTSQQLGQLRYALGCLIIFADKEYKPVEWYKNGQRI